MRLTAILPSEILTCHMEEMKIRDERARHVELMVPTFLPSDFIHLLLNLNTSESLFLCPHFEFVPLNLSVLPLSCPTTAVYADLLPSLTLFRSRLYSSFPRTDNKASFSMADLQFTPPCAPSHTRDSEGELQLRLQCGAVPSQILDQNLGPTGPVCCVPFSTDGVT